jgi:hypothetical protein
MTSTVRTVVGGSIQAAHYLGLPYVPLANTTINELYDIHHLTNTQADEQPTLGYFAIGNKGHRAATTADSVVKIQPVRHIPTDCGLYGALPFIIRPANADLTADERANYGMRVSITIDNVDYWAYYLKKINRNNIVPQLRQITTVDGVSTYSAWVPDNQNLTPSPIQVPNDSNTTVNGIFFSVTARLDLSFNAQDVIELMNVCEVLYGDPELAIVSEIALVSAITKSVSLLDKNNQPLSTNYFEALKASITDFISTYYPLIFSSEGFTYLADLGTTEPLFGPTTTVVQPGP